MNRQKAHAALDALLDAISEQAEEAPAAPRERRRRVLRHPEPPASYKPDERDLARARRIIQRAQ